MPRLGRFTWVVLLGLTLTWEPTASTVRAQNAEPASAQAAALDRLLDNCRFPELAAMLPQVSNLKAEQKDYFEGAVAFRRNRLDEAKKLLERAVNTRDPDLKGQERETVLSQQQVFHALMMLSSLYMRTYHYGAAADLYNLVNSTFATHFQDGGSSIRMQRHLNVVLKDVPPQSVSLSGEFKLDRNAEGYPIQVGDRTVRAIFDTGANLSQISETTAAAWGVMPLPGTPVSVMGMAGRFYKAHAGVIQEMRIGSATLHNVVVVIAPDEQLTIAEVHAQLRPVLGYPVAAALGKVTISRDGTLTIHSNENTATARAPLWLGDESLLVALNARPDGDEELFMLDTGSASTFLTDKYVQDHPGVFRGSPPEQARLAGAGGIREIPAYTAHHLPLWFGGTPIYLDGQHILTASQGGEAENYYGLIGGDVLGTFSSYTIDLNRMEFSVLM